MKLQVPEGKNLIRIQIAMIIHLGFRLDFNFLGRLRWATGGDWLLFGRSSR